MYFFSLKVSCYLQLKPTYFSSLFILILKVTTKIILCAHSCAFLQSLHFSASGFFFSYCARSSLFLLCSVVRSFLCNTTFLSSVSLCLTVCQLRTSSAFPHSYANLWTIPRKMIPFFFPRNSGTIFLSQMPPCICFGD